MLRYIKQEWIKLRIQRIFWLLTVALILVYGFFFGIRKVQADQRNTPVHRELVANLTGNDEQDIQQLETLKEDMNQILGYWSMPEGADSITPDLEELLRKYEGKLDEDPNEIFGVLSEAEELSTQLQYIEGYEEELQDSIQTLKERIHNPVLQHSSFSIHSLEKQSQAYEDLSNQPMKLAYDEGAGFQLLQRTTLPDVFFMLYIFALGMLLLTGDRELGTTPLISTKPHAMRRTAIAKVLLYLLITVTLSLALWGSMLLLGGLLMGYGDMTRNIQSMLEFRNAYLNLTLSDFLLCYLFGKVLFGLWIGTLVSVLLALIKENAKQFILFFAILLGGYLAYLAIPEYSYFSILKYSSVFAFADTFDIFGNYKDVALLSYPLGRIAFTYGWILLLGCLGIFLSIRVFAKERASIQKKGKRRWVENIRFQKLPGAEAYRTWLHGRGLLLTVLLLLLALQVVKEPEKIPADYFRNNYLINYEVLKGPIIGEDLSRFEERAAYFQSLQEALEETEEALALGKEDADILERKKLMYEQKLEPYSAFQQIQTQVEESLKETKGLEGLELLDEDIGRYWFSLNNQRLFLSLLFYLLLVLVVSHTFSKDHAYGMTDLLKTTPGGYRKMIKTRTLLYSGFATGMAILWTGFLIHHAKISDKIFPLGSLVQSTPQLLHFGAVIPFGLLLAGMTLYSVLSAILTVQVILFLSQKLKQSWQVYLVGGLLFLLPNIASFGRLSWIIPAYLPLSNAFTMNAVLPTLGVWGLAGYLLFVAVAIFLMYRWNRSIWKS